MSAAAVPDDGGCTVLHVQLDDFPLCVELLERPELAGAAVAVAGARGAVRAASAPARRAGVLPGTPLGRARRLCPSLTVLPGRPGEHERAWAGALGVLRSLTPAVQPLAPGSACLDVAGAVRRLGPPAAVARLLRDRVADEQGLTCSVGVAPTRLLAALAAGRAGPDALLVVPRAGALAFLHEAPVTELPGVGARTAEVLQRLGLRTAGDVAHTPSATLRRALGERAGRRLHALAWGRDERAVVPEGPGARAVAAEEVFARDVDDPRVVHRELLRVAARTTARSRAAGLAARTVALRVRFADGSALTRSRTLPERTDVTRLVHATAAALFDGLGLQRARLRGVGLRLEDLAPAAGQPRQLLLGERVRGWREADGAVDRAGARFGAGSVRPATLLEAGTPPPSPGVASSEDWSPPSAVPGGPGWWNMW
ncbi:DNA polymerase Y family protein [Kineococcus gypseus]|uniref:DNA polymerase Y family protein n=1 Tax=Kineococcus gypseus TaxID=1637102 RepID=UPI003D7DCAF6